MDGFKFCTQMPVPRELVAEARTLAIQENPKNAHTVIPKSGELKKGLSPSLALPIDTKWANGRTLRVKILNGSAKIKEKIRQYANVWTDYANITFDFVDSDDAEFASTSTRAAVRGRTSAPTISPSRPPTTP